MPTLDRVTGLVPSTVGTLADTEFLNRIVGRSSWQRNRQPQRRQES